MKTLACFGLALALAAVSSIASAGEVKSGLQPGERIGAFNVVKCSGAENDGVEVGKSLCYRCKYGPRPMVMVFTRKTDDKIVDLAKKLDAAVAGSSNDLKAFVNIMGTDKSQLEAVAKQIGTANKLANVPVVVPVEYENGPDNYGINPDADVTVIVAANQQVVASRGFTGSLSDEALAQILKDVEKATK